jgi:anti-sigma-K factor RskA
VNTQEYIQSGILEAYVLGALPPDEHDRVQADIALYPELAAEVQAIEDSMFHLAQATAQQPPAFMKEQIWNTLQQQASAPQSDTTHMPKTIPFTPTMSQGAGWARAAIWLVLIGSVLLNFMLWNSDNHSRKDMIVMGQQLDTLRSHQQQLVATVESFRKERDMLVDTGMNVVVMHSMLKGHDMAGMVFVDKQKGDAYLSLHKLPMPPQGKQYQLWVIKDGKPMDMGVVPNDWLAVDGSMSKISKQFPGGQAFAISLEKAGGNPTPTMEAIYVLGKMSS